MRNNGLGIVCLDERKVGQLFKLSASQGELIGVGLDDAKVSRQVENPVLLSRAEDTEQWIGCRVLGRAQGRTAF